jgi:hypothetical protein
VIDDVDAFTQAFVGAAGPGSGSSLLLAELRQLGGALGRPDPRGGALPMLSGEFVLFGLGMVFGPDDVARVAADSERLVAACAQWGNGRQYLNFAERPTDSSAAFDAAAWQRLTAVRSTYDPAGLFVANHAIG